MMQIGIDSLAAAISDMASGLTLSPVAVSKTSRRS
jgi:hypothetical protein